MKYNITLTALNFKDLGTCAAGWTMREYLDYVNSSIIIRPYKDINGSQFCLVNNKMIKHSAVLFDSNMFENNRSVYKIPTYGNIKRPCLIEATRIQLEYERNKP